MRIFILSFQGLVTPKQMNIFYKEQARSNIQNTNQF